MPEDKDKGGTDNEKGGYFSFNDEEKEGLLCCGGDKSKDDKESEKKEPNGGFVCRTYILVLVQLAFIWGACCGIKDS